MEAFGPSADEWVELEPWHFFLSLKIALIIDRSATEMDALVVFLCW
jgi:hypothetical protein